MRHLLAKARYYAYVVVCALTGLVGFYALTWLLFAIG